MPVYLRDLCRADLAQITRWRQDRELTHWLGEPHRYINPETDAQWFEHYQSKRHQEVRLAICKTDTHQHIGNVYLLNLHPVHRSAEFHLLIGERQAWGHGLGRQATLLGLNHAFGDLNLNRIELRLLAYNEHALHLYTNCGFRQEGVLRQAAYKDGQYHDMIVMGLLHQQWDNSLFCANQCAQDRSILKRERDNLTPGFA